MLSDVYGGTYDFGCNDPVLKTSCDPRCFLHKATEVVDDALLTLKDRSRKYQEFIVNLGKRRFRSGWTELDQEIRGVAPGELLTIVAYSGTYKSALLQHFLLEAGRTMDATSLFFSLEMPAERVHEREVQMLTGAYGWQIEDAYREKRAQPLADMAKGKGAEKVVVCDRGGLNLEQIEGYVGKARERFGDLGVLGIDYVGLMRGKAGKEYDVLNELYPRLKEFAKRTELPVILLSQVNREAAEAEITKKSGKGTGAVEASADFLLGLYRDGEKVIAKLLKNRNGAEGHKWVLEIGQNFAFKGLTRYVAPPPRKRASKTGEGFSCER
jgi:replicative DNA helicase